MRAGIGIYVTHSDEAVPLYEKAFNLKLGYHVKNSDGTFYHSELYRGDDEILSIVESSNPKFGEKTVQVGIIVDSEAEVKAAYEVLKDGAVIDIPMGPLPWSPCAVSLVDRFGVWWYISAPQHQPSADFDPLQPIR